MKFNIPKIRKTLKYLLFGLIIAAVLAYYPDLNIATDSIVTYSLLIVLVFVVLDRTFFVNVEPMGWGRGKDLTGLSFDNNASNQYMLNYDEIKPSHRGVPFEEAKRLLNKNRDRYYRYEFNNSCF